MKLFFQDKTFCLSVKQDLTLYEIDSNSYPATSKNTPL